jgi:aconitate hydratase
VLAQSFERIHRSNLIGLGILPLRMPPECAPERLRIAVGDRIEIDAPADTIAARAAVTVRVHRLGGTVEAYTAVAAIETRLEADLLRQGGVIPYILQQTIHQPRP